VSGVVAIALVVVTLLGAPLFAVIGAGALVGFEREGVDLSVVAIEFFGLSETPVLVAIPLFTFAGFLLSAGQAPARLVRLSQALLGWLPGGLAMISLVACAIFTAFTGASGVTIIASARSCIGSVAGRLRPAFQSRIHHTSALGLLFAPSRVDSVRDRR
jgi:TRAP-type mannitol/chloroaromatic compound transport system permease large subunit